MIGPKARKAMRMPFDGTLTSYSRRSERLRAGTMEYDIARGTGRTMAGLPNTRKMNGDPSENGGRIGTWTTKEERAWKRAMRKAERMERRRAKGGGLSGLLDKKKMKRLKDPHDDDDVGKVRMDREDAPDFLERKMARGGSVFASRKGMCLKGEEDGSGSDDGSDCIWLYSSKAGERKWRSARDIMPNSGGMFAWDAAKKSMGPGGALVGRSWVWAAGTGPKGDGVYSLKVTFSDSGGASAEVVDGFGGATTDTTCWIPIYSILDGRIMNDYRGAFIVQCWE